MDDNTHSVLLKNLPPLRSAAGVSKVSEKKRRDRQKFGPKAIKNKVPNSMISSFQAFRFQSWYKCGFYPVNIEIPGKKQVFSIR